jgi:hypothetical protein
MSAGNAMQRHKPSNWSYASITRLPGFAREAEYLRGAWRCRCREARLLRIIDESGEDYLYPKTSFRPIALPQALKKAVLAA